MNSKRINESFLEGESEETDCLLHTCTDVTKEFVSLEEMKNFHKEEKIGKQGRQDEETVDLKNLTT